MTMTNVEKIKFVQNQPLLNKLEGLFEEHFSLSSNDRVLKVLEIGCGPGDFALIMKDKFKERVQITAIEPGEKDYKLAKEKSTGNDVDFQNFGIFDFKSDVKYDLAMFTKSLHHCIPVDQAVKNAYSLISDDGIFLAEEVYIDKMDVQDLKWFFDRMDLLRSAGCMKDVKQVIDEFQFSKSMMAKLLDTTLPSSERWFRPHIHGEGGHSHGHNQDHHGHGNNHHHEHGDQQEDIVHSSAVRVAIEAQFGDNLQFEEVPYFYSFLSSCGLKNNETNEQVLQEFYKQEERAMKTKVIKPLGIYFIGHK